LCTRIIAQFTNLFAIRPVPYPHSPVLYNETALAQIQRQLFDKEWIAIGLSSQENRQIVGDWPAEYVRCQRAYALGRQRVEINRMRIDIFAHRYANRTAVVGIAAGEQHGEWICAGITRQHANNLTRVVIQPVRIFDLKHHGLPQAFGQNQRSERREGALEALVRLGFLVRRSSPAQIDQCAQERASLIEFSSKRRVTSDE